MDKDSYVAKSLLLSVYSKKDKTANSALEQIKIKKYPAILEKYKEYLLVMIVKLKS